MNDRDRLATFFRERTVEELITWAWSNVQNETDSYNLLTVMEAIYRDRRKILATSIEKLDVKPGEVLVVRVGLDNIDDDGPWVPTYEELQCLRQDVQAVVPEGVKIIAYHHGLSFQVIPQEALEATLGTKTEGEN